VQRFVIFIIKLCFEHLLCNTFSILSFPQGDLTEDADSNLYINPLEATEKFKTSQMKKSISGEVGRNIIAETLPSAESLKEASKINLNDMMPKHRKIRIQQVSPLKISICICPKLSFNIYLCKYLFTWYARLFILFIKKIMKKFLTSKNSRAFN